MITSTVLGVTMRLMAVALVLLLPTSLLAQYESRRDRGDRGSDRSDRYSGPSSGSFGSGFSGGGFGGGGFGSGFLGGFSGGGFGFNPDGLAEMIRRFDRNGNNMIDPEEMQGPASFFLQRMASRNSQIDLTKPVPVDTIVAEIERFRSGRSDSPTSSMSSSAAKDEVKLLVPDFRGTDKPTSVPGFGLEAEEPTIQVTDRDKSEAEERIRRYDRNNDKMLSADELAQSRYSPDEVAQYDRNHDGKITVDEWAVRQAVRRMGEQNSSQASQSLQPSSSGWGNGSSGGWSSSSSGSRSNRGSNSGGSDSKSSAKKEEKRFGDAKSYKMSSTPTISGLPSFFSAADLNTDAQVTLQEFAGSLTDAAIREFNQWDLNGDGIITVGECQTAVKNGVQVGGTGKSSTSPNSVAASSTTSPSATSSTSNSSSSAKPATATVSDADLASARKILNKYDQDKDGALSKAEIEKMSVKPTEADFDKDGKVSVEEYAAWRNK